MPEVRRLPRQPDNQNYKRGVEVGGEGGWGEMSSLRNQSCGGNVTGSPWYFYDQKV